MSAPAAMPTLRQTQGRPEQGRRTSRGHGNPRRGISVSSRWGWGPSAIGIMLIYGINPVLEALRAGRVTALRIAARNDDRFAALLRIAGETRVTVTRVGSGELDRLVRGAVHQGVVADVREAQSF